MTWSTSTGRGTQDSAEPDPTAEPDARPASTGRAGCSGLERLTSLPLTVLLTLYLMTTSRWGSYLGIPGAPFYISDIVIALATVQIAVTLVTRRASLADLARAPLALLLVCCLVAYAAVRLAVQLDLSVLALRDFAPYGYAAVAVLAYLLPTREEARWRAVIYAALVTHLVWVVTFPRLPGFPWGLPTLGSDATLLVARPDFDTMVMGLGAAFALNDLLDRRGRRPAVVATLMAFIAISLFGMVTTSTRAGFLAGIFAVVAVIVTRIVAIPVRNGRAARVRPVRLVACGVCCLIAIGALAVTPSGSRLVDGLNDASSTAYGTVSVRRHVWDRVEIYVLRDVGRTAVGVGFGRNFIAESGSQVDLEGSAYENVRSPHNYVLGTLARLGVAGALIVSLIIGLGWWLAALQLRRGAGPVGTLAALLVLAVPVIALVGVVFESPFGAITYFWGLGHLAWLRSVGADADSGQSETVHPASQRALWLRHRGPARE